MSESPKRSDRLIGFFLGFFLKLFFISLFISIFIQFRGCQGNIIILPSEDDDIRFWISIVSLVMSGISLLGFIITTIISLRKEKRESRSFALDNEKKQLEIQKLKTELQQAKEQSTGSTSIQKKKRNKSPK